MERLQAAIERAREQRDTRGPTARPQPRGTVQDKSAADEAWAALPEIKLQRRQMLKNRIMTFRSSKDSTPYDILRTRLVQQAQANGWRRIAITSPHSACGKTTTCANLAFGLGRQTGLRSVVLDFDLRRSGLGRILGQKGEIPMEDVLSGRVPFKDVAMRHGPNLAFGLGFGTSHRSAETLQSDQTRRVLEEIEAEYQPDLMLIDLPPMSASDDNFGFLNRIDAAIIVAEAEQTTMTQIDVAERQVAELTNVAGVVLNKCRYVNGAYGYEDGYY